MAILQVRNMDDRLYEGLKRRATVDNRSVSQQVITIIQRYLSASASFDVCPDDAVLSLAGSWQDERTTDEIVADVRKSRTKRSRRFREVF